MSNTASIFFSNGGSPYSQLVTTWSQTSGVTDASLLTILDTAVLALTSAGLMSKIVYCNPHLGSTAQAHATPLKNPLNTTSTHFGSPIYDSFGTKYDGISAYSNTNFYWDGQIANPLNSHRVIYQTNTSIVGDADAAGIVGFVIGQISGSAGNQIYLIGSGGDRILADFHYPARFDNTLGGGQKWTGFIAQSRLSSTNYFVYRQGAQVGSTVTTNNSYIAYNYAGTQTPYTYWTRPVFTGCANNPSNAQWGAGIKAVADSRYYSNTWLGWHSEGDGLTTGELDTYFSIMQTYQDSLGRKIT